MSLIAELRLDSPILAASFEAVPDVRLTYVQGSISDERPANMICRVGGGDLDAFEAAMDDDPTVSTYVRLSEAGARRLYRVTATEEATERVTYADAVELDVPFLDGTGSVDGWLFRMEFSDRDTLSAYCEACERRNVDFEINRLYTVPDADRSPETRLTDGQREALELAVERGYFEIPRNVSGRELGAELGISGQAVSERLRRGLYKAAVATLRREDDSPPDL